LNITIGRDTETLDVDNMGIVFIAQKKNSSTIPLNHLPCNCPICSNSSVESMRSPTNVGSIAVSLHNLYQQKSLVTLLTALIAHPETYKSYVLSYNSPQKAATMSSLFDLIDNIISYKRGYISSPYSWNTQNAVDSIEDLL
jgi:queuine/archaeosine tRNA-ribosyltransferase